MEIHIVNKMRRDEIEKKVLESKVTLSDGDDVAKLHEEAASAFDYDTPTFELWQRDVNLTKGPQETLVSTFVKNGTVELRASSAFQALQQLHKKYGKDSVGIKHFISICGSNYNETEKDITLYLDASPCLTSDFDLNDNSGYEGSTALMWASWKARQSVVFKLLDTGLDVNVRDSHGKTALMWAAQYGREAVVTKLIENGADLDVRDNHGRTALMNGGRESCGLKLIESGANLSIQDHEGMTALMLAAKDGRDKVAIKLIESGVDINITDKHGGTALTHAIEAEREKIVTKLMEKNKELQELGKKSLLSAAKGAKQTAVMKLAESGIDVNVQNDYGMTPLMYAAQYGQDLLLEKLLQHKADGNMQNKYGKTALMYAVQSGSTAAVERLIKSGVDTTIQDNCNKTAMIHARELGWKAFPQRLNRD